MKHAFPPFALALVLAVTVVACDSDVSQDPTAPGLTAGKAAKQYVCHVATLEDEATPNGKVDLIEIPASQVDKHLGVHCNSVVLGADGCDYYPPGDVNAADAKEDTDADGVDEACEANPCPCWDASELEFITDANHGEPDWRSCVSLEAVSYQYPEGAGIRTVRLGATSADYVGFYANTQAPGCSKNPNPQFLTITVAEAEACIEQIADRCAFVDSDVRTN